MNALQLRPDLGGSFAELVERAERIPGARPLSVGQASGGPMGSPILDMLARLGVQPCRMWGAEPPGGQTDEGCPVTKKVCGAIYPYFSAVPAAAVNFAYDMFAKKWFWPLFWADVSETFVTVGALEFQGDPVFENSAGTGPLLPVTSFRPGGHYGFVPGMPAFDSSDPLTALLNNADAAPRNFDGMFIGVSIRN